jgi:CubicO group peptidase (beta-lactamase class C family)
MYPIKILTLLILVLGLFPVGAQAVDSTVSAPHLALSVPSVPTAFPLTADNVNDWLDGYLPYALKTGDIAGAVVAVVKDGQILTLRGYGYADVAKRTPVDPRSTLFRPGSVAKLFTWTAVMQLVEQDKIKLDVDINHYLDFKIPPRDGQPITMRNLMQHTPGFEEYAKDGITTDAKAAVPYERWLKQWTPDRIFPVGVTPAYSNYGASLAGYIVQRVSGQPFDDYLEQHVFTPLQMHHSTFRQPLAANLAPLMSQGYKAASEGAKGFEFVGPAPAGSMSATAEDIAHFMIAQLQDGAYQDERILQAATAQEMHNSPLTLLPPLNRMELGFFETNINGREVIGHLGDTQYFHSALHLFLKENVGFYVSFNSLGKGGIAGSLRTALFDGFADRYFPGETQDGIVDADTAAQHAHMMAGHWIASRRSENNFFNIGGFLGQLKLSVSAKGELSAPFLGLNGKPRDWVEIAPFVWRDSGSHERLAAQLVDGKPVRFSIDLAAPFMMWDRAPWYKNTTWLMPLFLIGVGSLLLTALGWPVTAIVRRRYGATLALDARAMRAYRLSRIGALAILAALASWASLLALFVINGNAAGDRSDALLWLVEVVAAVGFIGGCALLLWNLWVVWRGGKRRWPAKLWSIVLALSALGILWVAGAFKLLSFGANY